MITVIRGAEPSELRATREHHLRKALECFNEHGPGSRQLDARLDGGYDIAKSTLFRRQHKKCAYCEQRTPFDESPTEHFRPKKHARRDWRDTEARVEDNARYWWLAWTWENLLFACTTCNGRSHKGNRFPLVSGSEPLAAPGRPSTLPLPEHHFDLAAEQPLLLDPADSNVDPLDHIRWRPLDPALPPPLWTFGVRGLSLRGHATARILRLDERTDFINAAFLDLVWPRARAELLPKVKSKSSALLAAWLKLGRDLVRPEAEFAAAKWCMLDALRTGAHVFKELKLPALPRPTRPPGA